MPLVLVLCIGILAFGLFDVMLGRPLPAETVRHSARDMLNTPVESATLPSVAVVAASETARCENHETACQLVALYRFVLTTVNLEASQRPWAQAQQHPARTLLMKRGDAADIAILFSSLLDQRHIRNYVAMLPGDGYVLACGISPSALRHAGGNWEPATPASDADQMVAADDPSRGRPTERIEAYAFNVDDAPCPCLLLDPSGPITQQPGDSLPFVPNALSALDLAGQRHALISSISSSRPNTLQQPSSPSIIQWPDTASPM